MLALVSRVRNCPEGVHSTARARLKVCEPSGQSPEPQWPYTGPVAEVRRPGRPDPACSSYSPVNPKAGEPTSSGSITLAASLHVFVQGAQLLLRQDGSAGLVYDGPLPPTPPPPPLPPPLLRADARTAARCRGIIMLGGLNEEIVFLLYRRLTSSYDLALREDQG